MIFCKAVPLKEHVIFSLEICQPVGIIEKSSRRLKMEMLLFFPQSIISFLFISSAPLVIFNTIPAHFPIAFQIINMEKTNFLR